MAHDHTLSAMPGEILVMIFKYHFAEQVLRVQGPRERLYQGTIQKDDHIEIPECMNILLCCKAFLRIGLPQLYDAATFRYDRRLLLGGRSLTEPDCEQIKPLSRLRNTYCLPQDITHVHFNWQSGTLPLQQLKTFRLQFDTACSNDADARRLQSLVRCFKSRNIWLELRLLLYDSSYRTGGQRPKTHYPRLRLIANTDGDGEVIEAYLVSKEHFGFVKSTIDALFGCDLPTLKFKDGKRRTVRLTDATRSHWRKFGSKIR